MTTRRKPARKCIGVKMLPEFHERLRAAAAATELPIGVIVERALREYLPTIEGKEEAR